jgi:hypothetical protein
MNVFDEQFPMKEDEQEALLRERIECTFIWRTRGGWPVGVTMTYLALGGKIWLACGGQRPRVSAIRRDDRVSVVVGEERPGNDSVTITIKGRCRVHDDEPTKLWFFGELARKAFPDENDDARRQGLIAMLNTPGRVVLEVAPGERFSFDLAGLFRAAMSAAT